MSQNMSTRRAKIMKHVIQIILRLLRFKSRESRRQKGMSQWQTKCRWSTIRRECG
jgi:hypothetical protein